VYAIQTEVTDKAGRISEELWRGIDGFALQFENEPQAILWAEEHLVGWEYKIVEY